MLSRTVVAFVPQCTQVRGMATLKDIRLRLKSVTNIQKITKSMKMVSAAKYAKAERDLKPARSYGLGAAAFFDQAEIKPNEEDPHHLVVAMTSDRGLCGGVHSSVVKMIKHSLTEKKPGTETKFVIIGDKAKSMLQRNYSKDVLMSFNEIGKAPPTFADASVIASEIMDLDYKYGRASIYFNVFKSVVAYRTTERPIFSLENVSAAEKLPVYDSVDDEILRSYNEFALVNLIYYALKEAACSELSARMTAMDGASKNAGEMIDKLTLTFNRTRQAVITRELIEIISGAAAL